MTDRPQPLLCAAGMALFLAAMVLAPILAGKFALGPQAAVTGVLLFAGALHLAGRRLGRARERLATPVDLPILVLVAGAFLSLPFSVNPHASVVEILRLLAGVAAFILAAEAAHSWRLQTADCRLQTARSPAAGGAGRPAPDSAGRTSGDGARRSRKVKRASQAAATAKPPRGRVTPSPVHLVTLSPLHLVTTAALPAFWVCVLAGAAWVAGMGVQEYLRALREHWGTWRSFGGFANPNSLAGHLALTMPLMAAAVLALRARTDEYRPAWPLPALILVSAGVALASTASRFGMAAAALGMIVFTVAALAAGRRLSRLQVVLLVVGLVVLGAAAVLAVPTLRLRLLAALSGAEGFSLTFRITTWEAAARMFDAHPWTGVGAGAFSSLVTRFSETTWVQTAHNHFVQTAAETGVLGLAGLVWLFADWFACMFRSTRKGAEGDAAPAGASEAAQGGTPAPPAEGGSGPAGTQPLAAAYFAAAALGGVAASVAHALVDFDWSIPATGWVVWALMGAGLGAAGATRRVRARPVAEWAALAVLLLGVAPAALVSAGGIYAGAAEAMQGTDPPANPALVVETYRQSLRCDPYAPETHRELGRLLGGLGVVSGDAGRADEGEAHLVGATRLAPTMSINYYHLGLLRMRRGQAQQAEDAFQRTLEWDPHNTFAWRQLGRLADPKRPAEMVAAARALVAIENSTYARVRPLAEFVDPNHAFAHAWLGQDAERAGAIERAVREYGRALAILNDYRHSKQGVGGIRAVGVGSTELEPDIRDLPGDTARRLAALEARVPAASPGAGTAYAFARFWLGWERERAGDQEKARSEYEHAQRLLDEHRPAADGAISEGQAGLLRLSLQQALKGL